VRPATDIVEENIQLTNPPPRPLYIIALTFHIPSGPPDQYLTLTLRHLGFDKFNTNLLSIPPAVFLIINVSRNSPQDKIQDRPKQASKRLHK
jgi:hypothetical protein